MLEPAGQSREIVALESVDFECGRWTIIGSVRSILEIRETGYSNLSRFKALSRDEYEYFAVDSTDPRSRQDRSIDESSVTHIVANESSIFCRYLSLLVHSSPDTFRYRTYFII